MTRIILPLIIFLGFHATAQTNKKLDSLLAVNQKYVKQDTTKISLLIEIAEVYEEIDLKKALEKTNEAVALAKRLNIPLSLAKAYAEQAAALMFSGDYKASVNAYEQAIKIYSTLGEKKEEVKMTNNLGNVYYLSHDFLKAKLFYEKAAKEAEAIGDKKTQAKALCNVGNTCNSLGEYTQSSSFFEKGIQLFEQLGDTKSVARNMGNLANSYQYLGDSKKALDYYFKAKKMNETMGNQLDLANNLLNIGYAYNKLKDSNNNLKYTKEALAIYEAIGNKNSMAVASGNIGGVYWELRDFKNAISYHSQVLTLGKELQDNHYIVKGLIDLSTDYADLKEFDKAFEYINQVKNYDEKTIDPLTKIGVNHSEAHLLRISPDAYLKANGYAVKDKYIKAEELLNQALVIAKELKNQLEEVKLYTELSLVYEQKGDFAKAYESFKKATEIKQQLQSEDLKKEITRKEIQFDYDKKEADLKYQQQLALKKVETQRLLLLALLVVVSLGGVIIYLRQRQKTLNQEKVNAMNFTSQLLENTEEERKRIASDLHDSVSHDLLNLKNSFHQDFSLVSTKIDGIIDNIRIISRNLHPIMFDKIGLVPNIEQLVERIQEQNDFMVSTEINYKGSLSSADELQIYRILQEALTNIIKYANAHAAKITIEELEDKIFIEIKDNGKGFNVKETLNNGKSFGLHNIIERSRVIGGEAIIKSSEEGTIITINIPKKL